MSGSTNGEAEIVILLHGLARTRWSMLPLAWRLERAGYDVLNIDYPTTRHPIEQLAGETLAGVLEECRCEKSPAVHFVTHSTGGIVVRYYLKENSIPNLGRVVMIAPPNRGTELVDRLGRYRLFRLYHGPAAMQMGTDEGSIPLSLGPVNFEVGILAGRRSSHPWFSWMIEGPNDGIVSIERAKVEGMTDFLVLPYSHTFIMARSRVAQQTMHFLRRGMFERSHG